MIQVPLQPFFVFVLIFLRTGFLLTFFPILGEKFVPLKIRILLCAAIAVALAGVAPISPAAFPHDWGGIARLAGTEALLGFGLAFIGKLMFGIIQYSGQIIGQEIGFGMVNSIDPSADQVTAISELQYLLAILLFFATDLHHVVLQTLSNSFEILPPGTAMLTPGLSQFMLGLGSTLFSLAIGFAMPVVAINFAINAGLAMIGRAAPQLNVFMESFPIRIIAGLSVMLLSLGFTAGLWVEMFDAMGGTMNTIMNTMK